MKNLILFLTLIIALSSCEDNSCKQCTTTITTSIPGYNSQTSTTTQELCGDDVDKVDGKTITSQTSTSGINATTTSKTSCK
jgi:hypothetical protein